MKQVNTEYTTKIRTERELRTRESSKAQMKFDSCFGQPFNLWSRLINVNFSKTLVRFQKGRIIDSLFRMFDVFPPVRPDSGTVLFQPGGQGVSLHDFHPLSLLFVTNKSGQIRVLQFLVL
jgi:hypothetical protein